jgi:hypothetical protein
MAVPLLALALALLLPGCALTEKDKSAREWNRAECHRVIDPEARERCLKQVD